MPRIVPEGAYGANLEAVFEIREHLAVARRGKTVGVREAQDRQALTSFAVMVYLKLSGSRLSTLP
jgi:hypothetical protein